MHKRIGVALLMTCVGCATLSAQTPPPSSQWNITTGALLLVAPTHAGSDQYRVLPFPMVQVTYRDRVFFGPSNSGVGGGIGAYLVRTQRVGVAAELGMMENRNSDRADVLAGTTDRDVLATVGGSMSYQAGPFTAALGALHGLNDGGGALGTAQLSYTLMMSDRLIVTMGGNAIVANARQLRREFGVTQSEADARAALILAGDKRLAADEARVFQPEGGLSQIGASLSLIYLVSQHWAATAFAGAGRLGDTAVESPLVREREQWSGGIGLVWRR